MDEFTHDLSVALKESSKELQQTVRRYNRKRKGKIRRNSQSMVDDLSLYCVDFPNRSEASEDSDAEDVSSQITRNQPATISLVQVVEATSDSEDQCGKIASKLSELKLPSHSLVSGADLESDSVTENHYGRKLTNHARRKRRAKLNASPATLANDSMCTPENERKAKPRPHVKKKEVMDTEIAIIAHGDRKRSSAKMETDPVLYLNHENCSFALLHDSSDLSSDDGTETCDERAGEADDEYSDFYHEINEGATYGIPNSVLHSVPKPVTVCQSHSKEGLANKNIGSISNKLKRTRYGKYGRQIKAGRRRLNAVSQERMSVEASPNQYLFQPALSAIYPEYKSAKRRRKVILSQSPLSDNSGDTLTPTSDTLKVPYLSHMGPPGSFSKFNTSGIRGSHTAVIPNGQRRAIFQTRSQRRAAKIGLT